MLKNISQILLIIFLTGVLLYFYQSRVPKYTDYGSIRCEKIWSLTGSSIRIEMNVDSNHLTDEELKKLIDIVREECK